MLSQLLNELMSKRPSRLFSVTDFKAGVFILPSRSSAIVPSCAFPLSLLHSAMALFRAPFPHSMYAYVYSNSHYRRGVGRSDDVNRVLIHGIIQN